MNAWTDRSRFPWSRWSIVTAMILVWSSPARSQGCQGTAILRETSRPPQAASMAAIAAMAPRNPEDGDPDDPPPIGCASSAIGHLNATPSSLNRWTDARMIARLVWFAVPPPNCPSFLGVSVAGRPVGLSGTMEVEITRTTTFALSARSPGKLSTIANATVVVQGDPGLVTVSNGRQLTAADVTMFDATWTQPFQHRRASSRACWQLYNRYDAAAWETGERMSALARMYELTHQRRYLDQLREFIEHALLFRDDHHPGDIHDTGADVAPLPVDEFRGRVVPAWGGKSVNSGGLHHVDEVVSSVYACPIAAFARIVAEEPALHPTYGDDAVRYANAVLETVWAFMPQIHYRNSGDFVEAFLTHLPAYRTKPTDQQCAAAYLQALKDEPDASDEAKHRYAQMLQNCKNLRKVAGLPMSHNENLAFAMVLIELSRALDSPFYRQSTARSNLAEPTRALAPLLVSRQQRYFVNHLKTITDSQNRARFLWPHADDLPSSIKPHAEDTSHGALTMRYVELLRRDFDRLNAFPASVGEPILLDSSYLRRFANAFLLKIAPGRNFADDITGKTAEPADGVNGECDGWMNLALVDVNVYRVCHDVSLRIVNRSQPYVTIGNHSALLMNKRALPGGQGAFGLLVSEH